MHLIIYTSKYVGREEDIDDVLADIVKRSKINNLEFGITGLLFLPQWTIYPGSGGRQGFIRGIDVDTGKRRPPSEYSANS